MPPLSLHWCVLRESCPRFSLSCSRLSAIFSSPVPEPQSICITLTALSVPVCISFKKRLFPICRGSHFADGGFMFSGIIGFLVPSMFFLLSFFSSNEWWWKFFFRFVSFHLKNGGGQLQGLRICAIAAPVSVWWHFDWCACATFAFPARRGPFSSCGNPFGRSIDSWPTLAGQDTPHDRTAQTSGTVWFRLWNCVGSVGLLLIWI